MPYAMENKLHKWPLPDQRFYQTNQRFDQFYPLPLKHQAMK